MQRAATPAPSPARSLPAPAVCCTFAPATPAKPSGCSTQSRHEAGKLVAYLGEMVGESQEIQAVRRLLKRVAERPARAVLVYGETGTGQGLVARLLHEQSPRAPKRLIAITPSSIPANK